MSRFCKVVAVMFFIAIGAFLLPAVAQTPVPPNPVAFVKEGAQPEKRDNDTAKPDEGISIIRMLPVPIETKGFQDKMKLKTALELFGDMFQGNLPIIVNEKAFAAEVRDPELQVYEVEVFLPPVPKRVPMFRRWN